MAFQSKNLATIVYVNGNAVWYYRTQDSLEDIMNDKKYFGNLWTMVACGDVIYINSNGRTAQRQIVKIDGENNEITLDKLD